MTTRVCCWMCAVALILSGLSPSTASGAQLFDTWKSHYVGLDYASAAAVADLNHDDIPDMVMGCEILDGVMALLGNADGTFDDPVIYPSSPYAEAVVIGDLNADGHPDVATANFGGDDVSVFLGNGDGTFMDADEYHTGHYPMDIVIGDVNEDGHPDLVSTIYEDNRFYSVLLNHGDGTFYSVSTPWSIDGAGWLDIGDLDNDGHLDLIMVIYDYYYPEVYDVTLTGDGDGTFSPFYCGFSNIEFAGDYSVLADMNEDGFLDMVTSYSDSIQVGLGDGSGCFEVILETEGVDSGRLSAADLDDDGHLDIVANGHEGISVLQGNGNGTFRNTGRLYGSGRHNHRVLIDDYNSDGILDLYVPGAIISLFPGLGDCAFPAPDTYDLAARPYAIDSGDLNDDGLPDLVTANAGSVSVLLGLGSGNFQPAVDYAPAHGTGPIDLVDLDGDGDLDLTTVSSISDDVSVFLGNGEGTFQAAEFYMVGEGPLSLAIEDLDGNGLPDLAVANSNSDTVSILLNTGDGTFQAAADYGVGDSPRTVASDDFDSDGSPDLALVNCWSDTVSILLNNGDGTFQSSVSYGVGPFPVHLSTDDLNADGIPDLVVANSSSDTVSVLLGLGDGSFPSVLDFGTGDRPINVTVDDLDGDGIKDLAVMNSDSKDISVLPGIGDGTFGAAGSYAGTIGRPTSLTIDDLNDDGFPDLVATSYPYGSEVSVLLGNGDCTFQDAEYYGAGNGAARALVIEDLNGDGEQDIAVAYAENNGGSNGVGILRHTISTVSADLICTPGSGTLPFSSLFQAFMTNLYAEQARRFQYSIDVTLADGQYFSNWRRGWQNVLAGETYTKQWTQTIPAWPSLEGLNQFTMTVADVTPPPYNLPPYPPAGDTDRDDCTVSGVAP